MTSLLVYGTDHSLLRTRQWVLEQGGFEVFVAVSGVEVKQILSEHATAALILCHSLSAAECRQALAITNVVSPQTKKLLLQSRLSKDLVGMVDIIFDSFEGPVAFIRTAENLIGMPFKDQAKIAPSSLSCRLASCREGSGANRSMASGTVVWRVEGQQRASGTA